MPKKMIDGRGFGGISGHIYLCEKPLDAKKKK